MRTSFCRSGLLATVALLGVAALQAATPATAPMRGVRGVRGVRGEPVARAVVEVRAIAPVRPERQMEIAEPEEDGPLPIPQDLPVPGGARVRMEARSEAAAAASALPPSPAPAGQPAAPGLPVWLCRHAASPGTGTG